MYKVNKNKKMEKEKMKREKYIFAWKVEARKGKKVYCKQNYKKEQERYQNNC